MLTPMEAKRQRSKTRLGQPQPEKPSISLLFQSEGRASLPTSGTQKGPLLAANQ